MSRTFVIGTRGSALALWQAEHVQSRLSRLYPKHTFRIKVIKTTGDKILNQALSQIGDKGLFTKEIEDAMLAGTVDIAVHSLKDLPTETPAGLHIAAITKRERVNDVLISKQWSSLADLPEGAVIATGSLRRTAQLRHLRPDFQIVDIRGNLNTRMKKFDSSKWDGMMLAFAGVKRLGWEDRIAQIIPTNLILPAVGQGALGIELREGDEETFRVVSRLANPSTTAEALAERSLLAELEGGCQVPIGALARVRKGDLTLDAMVASVDGSVRLDARASGRADRAVAIGAKLAARLLENGARDILEHIRVAG